jgi:hypothetical protein
MLNGLFAKARLKQGADPGWRVSEDGHQLPSSPGSDLLAPAADDLPLIVTKADEDARARLALKRMGYLRVRSAYLRYKRDGRDTFHSFGAEHLWPTMDFVRDWLKEERRRLIAQHRSAFLLTLLVTLAAGLAFVGALAVIG